MATFTDEILMAFVDGELDPAQAVEVQLALIADETLAKRIDRFRYVRRALRSTYDAIVKEPVPDHLLDLLNNIGQQAGSHDQVEEDPSEGEPAAEAPKPERRSRSSVWFPVATSVLIGVLIGRSLKRPEHEE